MLNKNGLIAVVRNNSKFCKSIKVEQVQMSLASLVGYLDLKGSKSSWFEQI